MTTKLHTELGQRKNSYPATILFPTHFIFLHLSFPTCRIKIVISDCSYRWYRNPLSLGLYTSMCINSKQEPAVFWKPYDNISNPRVCVQNDRKAFFLGNTWKYAVKHSKCSVRVEYKEIYCRGERGQEKNNLKVTYSHKVN